MYSISFAHGTEHLLDITIDFEEPGATHSLFLPVWNTLYQVRDFAQYVSDVRAFDASGKPLIVATKETSRWEVRGGGRLRISYRVFANQPGPFGAQVNGHHAFLNLAEVLMFTDPTRGYLATVRFADLPRDWKVGIALPTLDVHSPGSSIAYMLHSENYDHLVDSPVELSNFSEYRFSGEQGESYRVIVDASNYDSKVLIEHLKMITASEVKWMQDMPFAEYTFIYHFPDSAEGGGGMEHSYSTAIDLTASRIRSGWGEFDSLTGHEFFHLWNVKRIRPQGLEPVDYLRENYTDALWFSEGMTTTAARICLAGAGLIRPQDYLDQIDAQIQALQDRPAHASQSAEASSIDTWFDKYAYYNSPGRSVSYYDKGDVLGVLLDLAIRNATGGSKSLRDVFLYMNREYGKTGKPFGGSEGVRQAVEAVSGTSFADFFGRYVAGVDELPYDGLFHTVGLDLQRKSQDQPWLGFGLRLAAGVWWVDGPVSPEASSAGLMEGDSVLAIDRQGPGVFARDPQAIGNRRTLTVTLQRGTGQTDIEVPVAVRHATEYRLMEDPHATAEQLKRRREWLEQSW